MGRDLQPYGRRSVTCFLDRYRTPLAARNNKRPACRHSFLQAFRRFVSRKSLPKLIISDNAMTFQSASTYLKTFFDSTSVRDTFANMGIGWQFIPKRAPWYGGWWERLIGLTKTALKKIDSLPEPRDTTDGRYRDRNHHERSSIDVRFSELG